MSVDNQQNERLATLEANSHSLGRSIDQVRDNLQDHEATCAENWKEQREKTTGLQMQLKLILWVAGAGLAAGLTAAAEGMFHIFWGSG